MKRTIIALTAIIIGFTANSHLQSQEKKAPSSAIFSAFAPYPVYDNTYYPLSYHKIYSKEAFGNSVELDDGSIWKVRPSDAPIVTRTWRSDDYIVVTPSSMPNYTGCPFYMTNQRTGTYVYVSLQVGPIIGGLNTTEIIRLDPMHGDLTLRDGKGIDYYFQVPANSRAFLNDWYVGQAVIVGSNDNWLMNMWDQCEYILINVERNRYLKACQY